MKNNAIKQSKQKRSAAQEIKKRGGDRDDKKNDVEVLLRDTRKNHTDPDLLNEIPLRLTEISSFIQVIHASLESYLNDESFYQKHVGSMMYLFEERFDDLQAMVNTLVNKQWNNQHKLKTGA